MAAGHWTYLIVSLSLLQGLSNTLDLLSVDLLSRRSLSRFLHSVVSVVSLVRSGFSVACLSRSSLSFGPASPSLRLLSRSVPVYSLSIGDRFRFHFLPPDSLSIDVSQR